MYLVAVDHTFADVVEGFLDHFMSACASVVDVAEQVERAHRGSRKDKHRVDELVVLERRRSVATVDELTVVEGTTAKRLVVKVDALVVKRLVDKIHIGYRLFQRPYGTPW